MGKTREELREYNRQWRAANKERYKELCKTSNKKHAKTIRDRKKAEAQQYICQYLTKHPCVDCGESDIICLEFDHLPQFKKRAGLSELVNQGYLLKVVIEEIAKCEVVCSNCHKKRTAERNGYHYKITWLAQFDDK